MTDISIVARRMVKELKEDFGVEVYITTIKYADDTTGLVSAKTEAVDALLKAFGDFYSANGLKLKFHVLVVRPHQKIADITCTGQAEVQQLRLLGLFIDNKVKSTGHTKIICGRLTSKLQHLEALKAKASFTTLKEVTVSLIHSAIEHGALYDSTKKPGTHTEEIKLNYEDAPRSRLGHKLCWHDVHVGVVECCQHETLVPDPHFQEVPEQA